LFAINITTPTLSKLNVQASAVLNFSKEYADLLVLLQNSQHENFPVFIDEFDSDVLRYLLREVDANNIDSFFIEHNKRLLLGLSVYFSVALSRISLLLLQIMAMQVMSFASFLRAQFSI